MSFLYSIGTLVIQYFLKFCPTYVGNSNCLTSHINNTVDAGLRETLECFFFKSCNKWKFSMNDRLTNLICPNEICPLPAVKLHNCINHNRIKKSKSQNVPVAGRRPLASAQHAWRVFAQHVRVPYKYKLTI